MQVHLWSSKCGRNESQKKRGWKHKTQDETQQQNNFLSYLFTLSQSGNKPPPQVTLLFTSNITAMCEGASETGFTWTASLFKLTPLNFLKKNKKKKQFSHAKTFLQPKTLRDLCVTYKKIKSKHKPLFCKQMKHSDGELRPVKDKERPPPPPPPRELLVDYENVRITITSNSAIWRIAPLWRAHVSQDAAGAQFHRHLPQVSFQGKLGGVGGQFILIVCTFLWEQRTSFRGQTFRDWLSALREQRRRPPRLLTATERQKLSSTGSETVVCCCVGAPVPPEEEY